MDRPTPRRILETRSHGSCAVCGSGLRGCPVTSCPLCRTAIHSECEAWTFTCPTFGCRGALGKGRARPGGLPPPGARSSFARQPVRPRPIPVRVPREPLGMPSLIEGLWQPIEDPTTKLAILGLLAVAVLYFAGLLPLLMAKTRIARSLIMLAFWAQATKSSADLASAAGEGLGNLKR